MPAWNDFGIFRVNLKYSCRLVTATGRAQSVTLQSRKWAFAQSFQLKVLWCQLEPWYPWIHIWIHETYEFIYVKIIWIHHYSCMWIHIHEMIIWIHSLHWHEFMHKIYDFMKIWISVYEFKCTHSEFIYEYIYRWIQIRNS